LNEVLGDVTNFGIERLKRENAEKDALLAEFERQYDIQK
jgi:hypothetical protein